MPRLERLPEWISKALLNLPTQVNETAPFIRLARPLSACRVAIVTTAGLHHRGDELFRPGEQGYRAIPADTPAADIVQSHTSIGFDRVAIMRDLNITFPIARLRELAATGTLALASNNYSVMGALRDTARLENETGPEIARRLIAEGTDAALITPT
jgi:D-proline reductase (dithiol) PrdB